MSRRSAPLPREPGPRAVAELVAWLAVVAAGARRAAAARAVYLLVSPLGMPARGWLEAQLQARGLPITSRTRLGSWARISTAVQVRQHDPAHLRRAPGEAWGLEPVVDRRLVPGVEIQSSSG